MLSSNDIRNIRFGKSVGGYKQEEVDIFLDRIEVDYNQYERMIKELNTKVHTLTADVENYKNSQNSVQNVLVSAQKLADQIVAESKAKSDEIIKAAENRIVQIKEEETKLKQQIDIEIAEHREKAIAECDKEIKSANVKKTAIEKGTVDSIKRQQDLFNKLKLEISSYKADAISKCEAEIDAIRKLPDMVNLDPTEISRLIVDEVNKIPDVKDFIDSAEEMPAEEAPVEAAPAKEASAETETEKKDEPTEDKESK